MPSDVQRVPQEGQNGEKPLTVGALRTALKDCKDDEMLMVSVLGSIPDYAVWGAAQDRLIPWDHECPRTEDHHPGRDCPVVNGFTIYAQELGACWSDRHESTTTVPVNVGTGAPPTAAYREARAVWEQTAGKAGK